MKALTTNLLVDIFFSKYKIYRYILLINLLQKYYPELLEDSAYIKQVLRKNIKNNPYLFLTTAAIAGIILSRLVKRGSKG